MPEIITYDTWRENIFHDNWDHLDVLRWAFDMYGEEIVYACSFGAEGIVLIDLINQMKSNACIKFLDTNLHFPETYALIKKIQQRYPSLQIQCIEPTLSLSEQSLQYGPELWKHNPNLCCQLRKVLPLQTALKDAVAWISGLRREQSLTRKATQYVNRDDTFKRIKICPLIHWTWEDVRTYIEKHQLPYNPLHDKGYPSIGCAPCTNPVSDSIGNRDGRWQGLNKTECGLHSISQNLNK